MKANISEPRERVVTITMKESEAQSLLIVCAHIGGMPKTSRRDHFTSLTKVLKAAGIKVPAGDDNGTLDEGSIFFHDIERFNHAD